MRSHQKASSVKVVGKIQVFPVLGGGAGTPPALLTRRTLSIDSAKVEGRKVKIPLKIDDATGGIEVRCSQIKALCRFEVGALALLQTLSIKKGVKR